MFESIFGGASLTLLVASGLVCSVATSCVARAKGHNALTGFFVGLLFGVLGLLTYGFLPDDYGRRLSVQTNKKLDSLIELMKETGDNLQRASEFDSAALQRRLDSL